MMPKRDLDTCLVLSEIGIDPAAIKSITKHFKRANLRAAINWLCQQQNSYNMESTEKIEGYLQAFKHLCDIGHYEQASKLFLLPLESLKGAKLCEILGVFGNYQEVINCCQQLFDRMTPEINLICTCLIGNAYYNLNDFQQAEEYNTKALQTAQHLKKKEQEMEALFILGSIARAREDYTQAKFFYEKSLIIAQQLNDRPREAKLIQSLGLTFHKLGLESEALNYHRQALDIARQTNDRHWEGITLTDMSLSHLKLREYEQAMDVNQKSMQIAQEVNNIAGLGWCKCNRGKILAELGEIEAASESFREAIEIFQDINKPAAQKEVFEALALLYLKINDRILARENCELAWAIARRLDIPLTEICQGLRGGTAESET